ncbi:hypothetical protein SUNI508_00128 [Seiridium unicorne]|uniref:Uncharacterized protein n=1 Tax=Seiridium unicorne TaxID=138068 RepID=A0ABR2VIK0_9PEZI
MKFLVALTAAVASLVSASPAEIEKRGLTNFDQYDGVRLNLVNASFGPSRGLYYKGIGLAEIFDNNSPLQAVNAHSNPNVLAYGNLDRLDDDYPYITSKYRGSSGTFSLQSFYYGCIIGNFAGNCTIAIAGYANGTKVAGQKFDYRPTVSQGASMVQLQLDSSWQGIDSVRFLTAFLDRAQHPDLGGATFLDDIRYTYFS